MATWGELEKDSGLGLLGIKEKLTALEAEHALCGGDRRRQLARIEELEAGNAGMTAEKQELADQVTELRDQLAAAKATMAVSAVQSAEEGSEVAELRTKLATAAADSAECASLKAELRSLRRDLDDTKARLAAALEEVAFLRKKPAAERPQTPGVSASLMDTMEERLVSLGAIVREKDSEITALRNTVREECEERVRLLGLLPKGAAERR